MRTDELEYQINARIDTNEFEIAVMDEGAYWHIKITKNGASGGLLLSKQIEPAMDRHLDGQVARLLYAWVQTRYHRPITDDWFQQ